MHVCYAKCVTDIESVRVVRSFYANETRQNMSSIVSTTQHLDYVHGVDCASTVIRQSKLLSL